MRLKRLIIRTWIGMAIAVLFGLAMPAQARTFDPRYSLRVQTLEKSAFGLERYVVRPNDTLYAIAKRYSTSVGTLQALNGLGDSRLIFAGDALLVPLPSETEVATYQIKPGDTLFNIAKRFDTTVAALQSQNGIGDRNHIVSGHTIRLRKSAGNQPGRVFANGITLFPDLESTTDILRRVKYLGVNWVKIEVNWSDMEPTKSSYVFDALDALIAGLDVLDVQILLNVYAAPDWSRKSSVLQLNSILRANSGPPDNPADFGEFMRALAARYVGIIDAYEIWKSPNLLKYWTVPVYERPPTMSASGDYGLPDKIRIGAAYYLDLLKIAYEAIKSVDRDALVITAGLAPVGITDHYNSVETGLFLQNMLHAGAADYSDGIGAIFGASAVPPALFCCEQPPGVDTHYESHLQYYREILYMYHDILSRHASDRLPIYVTQAGWGTIEGSNLAIPASGLEWLRYTDQDEQALYVPQAYKIAYGLDYIEGMFLYNLNGCTAGDSEACFFSLVDADGVHRPVLESFAAIANVANDS